MSMKQVRKDALERINKLQGKDGEKIGIITYWSCEGRIKVSDLRALFAKHGLDEEWFPPDIRGSAAFRKAIAAARGKVPGFLIRPIVDDDDKIVWGVTQEKVDKINVKLKHSTDTFVTYHKATKTVTASGPAGDGLTLAQKVRDAYSGLTESFIAKDIQRMLKRNIGRDMGSVTLRRGGGFYFTMPKFLPLIKKHEAIVNEINDSDMSLLILTDRFVENVQSVGRDTRRSLEDDLNALRQEIEEFRTGNPRETTLQERLEEYKQIKARCDTYADMLGIQVDDLKSGITDCAKQMRALLGEVQVANAEKDEKRKEKRRETERAQREALRAQAAELKRGAQVRRVRKVVKKK